MACKILVVLIASLALTNAAIPTVKVLQGPGSKTRLYGPDGSALYSAAPGGTLVTNSAGSAGLVAAGPAILPGSPEVVIGGGSAGKIVTSYTLAGPAVVPAVAPSAAVVAAPAAYASPAIASSLVGALRVPIGNFGTITGLYDDGSYKPDKYY